ncbi:hypothetical protein [Nocardia arthritidis]|uniref:Uncharacterized protein n=1 Tax=Nocardia arthritidis TaxID=228602 RepID=A0A6G9YTX9_9NOCA|nr:hypothetical protein [Nocardia arthritidis]QIS16600.1 hypothetical protein F5544_43985 [Nocardia arthritidis]
MDYTVLTQLEMAEHVAPAHPLTIDGAHEAMRVHRACVIEHCRRKAFAFDVLVAAGRIVPDSSRRH